jgi:hypothetical protein
MSLGGSGQISGFGKAYVSASISSVGFIATGAAHGTLVLAGSKGTITLSLTGTQQGGPRVPTTFTFKTVVGTGKFWNAHDTGTATLTLTPKQMFGLVSQGGFALTLASN